MQYYCCEMNDRALTERYGLLVEGTVREAPC